MGDFKNKVDIKWVRRKMTEAGISSNAELGRRSGIQKRALITYILQGKRNIQEDNLIKMAKVLKVSPRELSEKIGGKLYEFIQELDGMGKDHRLVIRGTIDDRFSVVFFPDNYDYKDVQVDIKPGAGAYALQYNTENTPAAMFDGSVAVILEKREIDPPSMLLRNNVVWLSDGRVLLRRVKEGQLPDRYTLDGANVPPIYDVELLAFAPVQALLIAP
ncbi:MAG: hypothetical protein JSC189_000047 [Candidatus Tokpelaia sp. JSC189]|nr:MAG: hypothetical protein JSC189_000047 [Candidatus Tokpelaia sp. JSC189]